MATQEPASPDIKGELHSYLQGARDTLLWKLEGLDEYDIRRPVTPTGTNLLGLVKHNAISQVRSFGDVFGRAHDISLPQTPDLVHAFWAAPDESSDAIVALFRRASELADQTIGELPLDAVGRVPWWDGSTITLHHALVHVTADTQRHAGHADIVRELIDGSAGLLRGHENLLIGDVDARRELHERIEAAARIAGGR